MSSLSEKTRSWNGRHDAAPRAAPVRVKVNPLVLAVRSRLRSFRRRLDGMTPLRPGAGSLLALSFVVGGWFYGSVVAGTAPAFISGIGSGVGLEATQVVLTGQVETGERELVDALAIGQNGSLLGFDAAGARDRLKALPWVKDVAIRKLYPGKLLVALVEKRAAAVWQHNDRLTVVDMTGKPIARFGIADLLNNRFSHLPHLIGKGASKTASEILPDVAKFATLSGRVTSYTRIADRRWDLGLANGMQVLLPEHELGRALTLLADMASGQRLLERAISVVDLRLPDRVVFRLQPEAVEARATFVTARSKAMKELDRKL